MTEAQLNRIPWTFIVAPLAALAFLGLKAGGLVPADSMPIVALEAVLLGLGVFAAVHHAEILALKVGEPMGSIVLALAVTVIEAALIISQMSSGHEGAEFIGRNTVFSGVMIVLNGVVGLCLLLGGARHHEQTFRLDGATAALSVLATLACIALILPNYTLASPGPYYSVGQLAFVGLVSLVLYTVFVAVQTVLHRNYFSVLRASDDDDHAPAPPPQARTVLVSTLFLPVALVVVVLMAKTLSGPINSAIAAAHLPAGFVGTVIALLVILPEGLAALRAAGQNQLQTSLNLALGSAIATIGLTIPTLAVYSVWADAKLALGLSPQSTTLLVLTLFVSSVTLATGRTTILQGAVHLVIFGVFMFLAAVP